MLDMMRREEIIFDNITGKWEKLAFSLYCEIVDSGNKAAALLPPDEKKAERGCATCKRNHYTKDNAVACDAEVPTGEDCVAPRYKYWEPDEKKEEP